MRAVGWAFDGGDYFLQRHANLVANFVRTQGVAGNWQWLGLHANRCGHSLLLCAALVVPPGVLTDLEFYELRYSGQAASAVRGFREPFSSTHHHGER